MNREAAVVCLCPVGMPVTGQSWISSEVVSYFRRLGCAVTVINRRPFFPRWLHYLATVSQILWVLFRARRPALAYLTCSRSRGGFLRDALFIVVCRLRRIPTINHVHGSDLPALLRRRITGPAVLRLLNGLAANIVLTEDLAGDCRRAGLDRVTVLPNCCGTEFFHVARRQDDSRPIGMTRILYLSNVTEQKGIFDLIEACRSLVAKRDLELHVVGQIIERNWFRQRRTRTRFLACVSANAFLKWTGPAHGSAKLAAYAAAHIFCLPSRSTEGVPIALLEAMAAGLPIVTTRVGGIPAATGDQDAALLAAPGDAERLAECLGRLMEAPDLRQRLGVRARERAWMYHTLSRFLEGLDAVVSPVLGRGWGP